MYRTETDRKLRVFFSVDVVGSTDYKTRHSDIQGDKYYWGNFFEDFFIEFPKVVKAKVAAAKKEYSSSLVSAPLPELKFWKMTGDEILYAGIIENPSHAYVFTKAFYRAVYTYDQSLVGSKWNLRVKGTGWTAGFPIRNTEIGIGDTTDYIGPDIDIGFRICGASRPGRMVASMDLVDILARHSSVDHFQFYNVGWEKLKGVFQDKPYPIYWIKERDDKPKTLPWESSECAYTKVFLDVNGLENLGDIQYDITGIRNALKDLKLFSPYFSKDDMPEEHREIWEEWRKAEKADNVLVGTEPPLGEDLPSSQPPSIIQTAPLP